MVVKADRGGLPPARFALGCRRPAALAVLLGAPLGSEQRDRRIVSGLHREIRAAPPGPVAGRPAADRRADQPRGSSGGAVVNAAGEVIGISEAYVPRSAGAVALELRDPGRDRGRHRPASCRAPDGRARHAFAGLVLAPVIAQVAQQLGLNSTDGMIVAEVAPGGPAGPGRVVRASVSAQRTGASQSTSRRAPPDPAAALCFHRDRGLVSGFSSRGTVECVPPRAGARPRVAVAP